MERIFIIMGIIVSFTFFMPLGAISEPEFSGYLEDTVTGEYMKSDHEEVMSHVIRARVNVSGKYGRSGDYSLSFIGARYGGQTVYNLVDYLPGEDAINFLSPIVYETADDYWIQEAFGTFYMNGLTLRAGRQKYYTGTGYAWNPTDLFNDKNVFDPSYEIEGLDSLYVSFSLNNSSAVHLFYSFPEKDDGQKEDSGAIDAHNWQVKINTRLRMWELALLYSDVKKTYYEISALQVRNIKWQLVSGELSGQLFGIGIHGEGGYAFLETADTFGKLSKDLKDHARFLLGVDYTFENELFLMAEYYFEGLGETSKNDYSIDDRMAYFLGTIDSIGRDNLFLGMRYPMTDLTTIECSR